MANEDSFLNEVSEEVRRDRLYAFFRRYGWIAILLVLLIVAGAAWNEWRKAEARAEAEARGDAILTALEADSAAARAQAVSSVEAEGAGQAIVAMLSAAQAEDEAVGAARDRLEAVASDPEIPRLYRDLATLKVVSLRGSDMAPADRLERLEPLTQAGAPYRPLALEASALAHVAAGDTEAALKILTDLISDAEATQGLRQRASRLIVALGGEIDAG